MPGQLNQIGIPDGNAFAEVRLREIAPLHDLPGFELHLADRRAAVQSGAFVEKPVNVLQTLSVCVRVVRICADDAIPVDRQQTGFDALRGDHQGGGDRHHDEPHRLIMAPGQRERRR